MCALFTCKEDEMTVGPFFPGAFTACNFVTPRVSAKRIFKQQPHGVVLILEAYAPSPRLSTNKRRQWPFKRNKRQYTAHLL